MGVTVADADFDDLGDLSEHLLLLLLLLAVGVLVGLLRADGVLVDLLLSFRSILLPLPADGALVDLGEQVGDDPAGAAVEVLLDDLEDLPPLRAWRTSPHLVRS